VARNHRRFVRQNQQARLQRVHDLVVIPARQVGASDASGEQSIPRYQQIERNEVEANRTLGVPRRVQYLGTVMLQSHRLPIDEAAVRGSCLRYTHSQPCCLRAHHLEQRKIVFVQVNWRPGKPLQSERPTNVIDMSMGYQDLLQREALVSKPLVNAAHIITGIDHDGLAGLLIAKNRAVALQRTDRKSLENHMQGYCRGEILDATSPTNMNQNALCLSFSLRIVLEALL
jgi:hypothetical protein